jgi:PAS domain S-box-containing protein/putative nucleotidyltransferase with HDIG domain
MPQPLRVLIVEDQPTDVELTVYVLRQAGFDPIWKNVHTRAEYLASLQAETYDIILADFTLPQFDAIHALELLKTSGKDIPFIVVSGTISEEVAVQSMKMGAADYLLKDRLARLGPAIEHALAQKALRDREADTQRQIRLLSSAVEQSTEGILVTDIRGNILFINQSCAAMHGYLQAELFNEPIASLFAAHQHQLLDLAHKKVIETGEFNGEFPRLQKDGDTFPSQTHISILRDPQHNPIGMVHSIRDITERKHAEQQIQNLLRDLQHSNAELADAYDATLAGWVRFLDLRDQPTEGHTQRVTELTLKLAQRVGIHNGLLVHVRRGALLHDIGKMGIPDSILQKPGPLNDAEWQIMRMHPVYAYQILSPIEFLQPALEIPHHHHERWDGKGYPDGLARDQIPLTARIFSVVDVYDALNSDRPYRKAWPLEQTLDHIARGAGSQFDPDITRAFLEFIAVPG